MEQKIKDALTNPEFFQYFLDETTASSQLPLPRNVRIQRHSQQEILLVVSGESTFVLGDQAQPAIPGSVFFINHWISHQLGYPAKVENFTHVWLHLHKGKLFASILHWENTPAPLCQEVIALPQDLYLLVTRRWENSNANSDVPHWKINIQRGIIRLLCEEFSLYFCQQVKTPRDKYDLVDKVQNYIALNCGRNSSLAALEKFSGYNRFYLTRLFKSKTGYTIGDYIDHIRRGVVNDARSKNIAYKEIAWQLGFSSAAAFGCWKKQKM